MYFMKYSQVKKSQYSINSTILQYFSDNLYQIVNQNMKIGAGFEIK